MPRVTFSAEPCVRIAVRGEGPDDRYASLDDGGIVTGLLQWFVDLYKKGSGEQPVNQVGGGMSGGGRHEQSYVPDDADRVVSWLRAHGAVEVVARGYRGAGKPVPDAKPIDDALLRACEGAGYAVERVGRDVYSGRVVLELRKSKKR